MIRIIQSPKSAVHLPWYNSAEALSSWVSWLLVFSLPLPPWSCVASTGQRATTILMGSSVGRVNRNVDGIYDWRDSRHFGLLGMNSINLTTNDFAYCGFTAESSFLLQACGCSYPTMCGWGLPHHSAWVSRLFQKSTTQSLGHSLRIWAGEVLLSLEEPHAHTRSRRTEPVKYWAFKDSWLCDCKSGHMHFRPHSQTIVSMQHLDAHQSCADEVLSRCKAHWSIVGSMDLQGLTALWSYLEIC